MVTLTENKETGTFYPRLLELNNYDEIMQKCITRTVEKLQSQDTSKRPGMLLGKIQSGKTRTFIGVMAYAYDQGFDVVIILTKNSNALAQQTTERLAREFNVLIDNELMRVYDIMKLPDHLKKYALRQKLAFVVKKETKNMDKLRNAFFERYPVLAEKKILFIDDEADLASISFEKDKESEIMELRTIASKIDKMRADLSDSSFLQVTATPYSLYLQPEDMIVHEFKKYEPVRPAFTELVPIHDKYVGGEMYFENSQIDGHMAKFLFEEVTENELDVLKKIDKRRTRGNSLITHKNIRSMRNALVNFLVGGGIRRWQQQQLKQKQRKYSLIVHTERGKGAHAWQELIMSDLEEELRIAAHENQPIFQELMEEAYSNVLRSLTTIDIIIPSFEEVVELVKEALIEEEVTISIVNSEKDVDRLLDETGQLRLDSPFNIFIGGQILDRGVTIDNLIGFFYGRNPKQFQQDTVLQHSRMYGARPLEDVAVTRFYTTQHIWNIMNKIHEFDTALREAFERGGHEQGIIFIQKDLANKIVPCSPNKIMLSQLTVLKPHKRILPVGFNTKSRTAIEKTVNQISQLLVDAEKKSALRDESNFTISVELAKEILTLAHSTVEMEDGYAWEISEYYSILDYLTKEVDQNPESLIWVVRRENRNIKRKDDNNKYENSPDTPKGERGELTVARRLSTDIPALIMLCQNGLVENGWRGAKFWWPVLIVPKNITTTIYSKKTTN
ncbi:Z1 domain-containing protein [Paenibacillus andongensis]|uniref:Z1 domain-containing protein n=1 Tax=Paenibacillus andongensis TaxID=2975482 RepID=UPI0021BB3773|nr:Z1 domain-containing protein [Paenibacillus andongensis]